MTGDDTWLSRGDGSRLSRRALLVGSASVAGAMAVGGGMLVASDGEVLPDPLVHEETTTVTPGPESGMRHWLGPELWGNRLQDWRNRDGRIECLRGDAGSELRTVALLTRELVAGADPAHLRVRTGVAGGPGTDGFAGFLVGTGTRDLHHRGRALVQRSSGVGGGLLCTYESDGTVGFRDHTDEENPVAYRELRSETVTTTDAGATDAGTATDRSGTATDSGDAARTDGPVRLSLDVLPRDDGSFDLHLRAADPDDDRVLARAVRRDVPEETVLGGISLVSSPLPGQDGLRWWFEDVETAGGKVAVRPDRTFGPIAGTLYSLDGSVLKLAAHLLPTGESDPDRVTLRYRPAGSPGSWRTEQASIGPGHTALFRIEDWDASRDWEYEVGYRDATGEEYRYEGRVDADPTDADEVTLGLLSCTAPVGRALDSARPRRAVSSEDPPPGRYAPGNVYFPHERLTDNLAAHDPDLLVCVGDQVYEPKPTTPAGRDDPDLDYLYKWYLWLWSVRDLTRDRPTILLVDDHDVYQPNVWGSGGEATTMENLQAGGYVATPAFVNRVQRIQCGHDPDPYDPRPTDRGIGVYYGAFTYGGVRFAMLEDRKFKTGPKEGPTGPNDDADPGHDGTALLGSRQEAFLAEWADETTDESVEICLTQTVFANALTDAERELVSPSENPAQTYDTNAYPKEDRDRAIRLFRDAGALVLAGDLHLPMVLRHGLDGHTDGVVQFAGPGGAANFPRWFRPARSLPNGTGRPNTGEFTDALGNECRMLAVHNPGVSHRTFERTRDGLLFDQHVRPDGYGIVRVDHDAAEFAIECWPWDADPGDGDDGQYPGWPYRLGFDAVDGRES